MAEGKIIMVVDDNHDTRVALRNALEAEGYTVISAANGKNALEVLSASSLPSLILLDLMMPILGGVGFLELIRKDERLAAIPVVVITASTDPIPPGANAYIRKPLDLASIFKVIEKYAFDDSPRNAGLTKQSLLQTSGILLEA